MKDDTGAFFGRRPHGKCFHGSGPPLVALSSLAVTNTPTLALGDSRHWQADTVHQVVQLNNITPASRLTTCLDIFIQLTLLLRAGLGHRTLSRVRASPVPLPVELQRVAFALLHDLIFWQATEAVQLCVILVPSHLWLWVS